MMQSTTRAPRTEQNRDLMLAPDTYAYLQNEGKGGLISVFVGPTVINQTGQDCPVIYDPEGRKYKSCDLEGAVKQFPRAEEDEYIILENPAEDGNKFPTSSNQQATPLQKGLRIIVPGPWTNALWPGQNATVIPGHRLRSNQYLIVSIYNEKAAEENWSKAVVKAQTEVPPTGSDEDNKPPKVEKPQGLPRPDSFAVGTRIIIKGTDVSFFIPPTGVEVVKEESTGHYVREAVTLEQLEYCVLIDESGSRTFPKGPQVVFPQPTQIFATDSQKNRKFRPLELNTINGVHLKVTKTHKGPDLEKPAGDNGNRPERNYKEGEELFVTGKTVAIYFPQEEFSIIEYGKGNSKHFSTAIPKGEGRYVINRESGEIGTVKGPKMLLPDPRNEIIVRRVLSDKSCTLLYPLNVEALAYNQQLAATIQTQPSGRSGFVSEGDYQKLYGGGMVASANMAGTEGNTLTMSAAIHSSSLAPTPYNSENVGQTMAPTVGRGTVYTEPRRITLNTKYDGVPKVEIWPGYAMLIVGAEGNRRVEVGPKTILLDYDEEPGFMSLSTGKPKTTDRLIQTAYLCVQNNQVGDVVPIESKDHVKGSVKISLRVNFDAENEEDRLRWFSVDNYVKYLTDHVRSLLAGMAKRNTVAEIKANYVNLVRDAILGQKGPDAAKRPGLLFEDNGMRVVEVEVLDLTLADQEISKLLDAAQYAVVKGDIEVEQKKKQLELTRTTEELQQASMRVKHETQKIERDLRRVTITEELEIVIAKFDAEIAETAKRKEKSEASEAAANFTHEQQLARSKSTWNQEHGHATEEQKLKMELLKAQGDDAVNRMQAARDGLYEILTVIQRDEVATKVAEATNIERFLSNGTLDASLANLFATFPAIKAFLDRSAEAQKARVSNGNRLSERVST